MKTRTVIIGGGVVGAMCAYYLTKANHAVTVVDRGTFGGACSHANCGYVCPSHVLPLATPEAVWATFKTMFKRNSAFRIAPRFDLSLWSWLLRFLRRCNERDMRNSAMAIQPLLESSRHLYSQMMKEEGFACDWREDGLLFVFQSERGFEHFGKLNEHLSRDYAMPATPYISADLEALEPALIPGLAGGWHYQRDAHLRPDRLMSALKAWLIERGVEFRENEAVNELKTNDRKAVSVSTSVGEVVGDHFVFATGAWTPLLANQLGVKLPIQPGKGYSITMPRPTICPRLPMIFEEHHVAVTPWRSGYRIGSTMEFGGYDERLNPKRVQILRDGAAVYLREPEAEPVEETWYGFRPMTPDSVPYIGRVPKLDNGYVAAGHNMLGLSMAPATGKLVQEMICNEKLHLERQPYRVKRS